MIEASPTRRPAGLRRIGRRDEAEAVGGPGVRTVAAWTLGHLVALVAATWPVVPRMAVALPGGNVDPAMHLWVIRWYRTCLAEGRPPWFCGSLQAPVGAPLGLFSPLQLQAILCWPLSLLIGDDVIIYNVLWIIGFLLTGVGTSLLVWEVTRDRRIASLGGLSAMLCGSMTVHAFGHLELLYLGGFPIFLVAWLRFVDRPGIGRLFASAAAFVLLAAGAAYYMVQATIPAALYVAWRLATVERAGRRAWVRSRAGWLAGFIAVTLPVLTLLFSGSIWAALSGYSIRRPESHYNGFVSPWWSYAAPTPEHRVGRLIGVDLYGSAGYFSKAEAASYLGVVALASLAVAALGRVRFPRASFWWIGLGVMVVLAVGPWWTIGGVRVPMPSRWLWEFVPTFRWTRNPGRFNLFATVFAAVIASAGLQYLIRRVTSGPARSAIVGALAVVAVVDLGVALPTELDLPSLPPSYQYLTRDGRRPAILEVPTVGSGLPSDVNAIAGYWQAFHGAKTSAGYGGNDNVDFDNRIHHPSPFAWRRPGDPAFGQSAIADPEHLADPERIALNLVRDARFDDYAWLFTHANGYDAIVVHRWAAARAGPEAVAGLRRVEEQLAPAKVFEDDRTAAFDVSRLPEPARPVLVCLDGWRYPHPWQPTEPILGRRPAAVGRVAEIAAYAPAGAGPIRVAFAASAFRRAREVRLADGSRTLGRWRIAPGSWQVVTTGPIDLPAGIRRLVLVCDGEDRPSPSDRSAETDDRPIAVHVADLRIDAWAGLRAGPERQGAEP